VKDNCEHVAGEKSNTPWNAGEEKETFQGKNSQKEKGPKGGSRPGVRRSKGRKVSRVSKRRVGPAGGHEPWVGSRRRAVENRKRGPDTTHKKRAPPTRPPGGTAGKKSVPTKGGRKVDNHDLCGGERKNLYVNRVKLIAMVGERCGFSRAPLLVEEKKQDALLNFRGPRDSVDPRQANKGRDHRNETSSRGSGRRAERGGDKV